MIHLEKVANVLDKVADYIDSIEATRVQEIQEHRQKLASILRERFQNLTGDHINDDVLDKIAKSDIDILATFQKLVDTEKIASDLGSPADALDATGPMTTKEAAAVAEDRFTQWILGE